MPLKKSGLTPKPTDAITYDSLGFDISNESLWWAHWSSQMELNKIFIVFKIFVLIKNVLKLLEITFNIISLLRCYFLNINYKEVNT